MLVPAVCMGEFGRLGDRFYLLVTGDICLGWAIAIKPLAKHRRNLRAMMFKEYKAEDQRCAQGAFGSIHRWGLESLHQHGPMLSHHCRGKDRGLNIVARSPCDI